MDKDQESKRDFITAFFDESEARVEFLDELAETGHVPEAMTLALVYIDRFSQSLCWPINSTGNSTGRNFVDALIRFGGEPLMALAHPRQAAHAFGALKSHWKDMAERIKIAFPGPSYEVVAIPEFEQALVAHFETAELAQLKPELWRATIANLVYQHLRNPAIHGFGTSGDIVLSNVTWKGHPLPVVGYAKLQNCAKHLIAEARRRSEANGQWFGNDEIVR